MKHLVLLETNKEMLHGERYKDCQIYTYADTVSYMEYDCNFASSIRRVFYEVTVYRTSAIDSYFKEPIKIISIYELNFINLGYYYEKTTN